MQFIRWVQWLRGEGWLFWLSKDDIERALSQYETWFFGNPED